MTSTAGSRVVLRPTAVRVLAVVTWVLLALQLGWTVLAVPSAAPRAVAISALIASVVWALFWRPGVAVDDESVTLVNVLRDVRVPFSQLRSVQTRYAMQVETTGRSYTAWAAPAPGRTSSMSLTRREATGVELLGTDLTQGVSASAAPNTDSGAAAMLVRHRWAQFDERDVAGVADLADEQVVVSWAVPVLSLLVLTGVASVLAVVL